MMVLRVGVVVLNFNGKNDTLTCLDSLAASQGVSRCLLVVDNGSMDGTVDALVYWGEARGWPVRAVHRAEANRSANGQPAPFGREELFVLRLDSNLGYTGGNNAGIEWCLRAGADAILILNNDTWVASDVLRRMVDALERSNDAGIIGCRVVDYDGDHVLYQGANLSYWLGVHFLRRFKGSPRGLVEVNFVPGCAMLVRASVLRAVGGFRDDLFLYTDDIEFCHRVRRAGWKILANLDAVIRAKVGSPSSGGPRSAIYYYFVTRNTSRFIVEELRGLQRLVALTMFMVARLVQIALWLGTRRWDRINGVVMGFVDFVRGVRGPGWAAQYLQFSPPHNK